MFGRRKREEAAAAEAAREAERHALFARLAERPEHVCPFLGLEGDRTGYVEGVSDEHRCFAFGDPATISAEQQTRVCQERGYGNCPRYLRGVLVIPTEELEALRRPRAPMELPPPAPPAPEAERRRRGAPIFLLLGLVLLLAGGAAAFLLLGGGNGIGTASPRASASTEPTAEASITPPSGTPEATPLVTAEPTTTPTSSDAPTSGPPTPTPEPTPEAGDQFAFYEVSVGPTEFTLFLLDSDGDIAASREASFGGYSFARVEPIEGTDGEVYWVTQEGGLEGWGYTYPRSGEFRVRAVFLNDTGERRSEYLEQSELTEMPEATPAP